MAQLVELRGHAEEFKALNAELVFVYREESEGVEGLKKIKAKYDPPFRLMLDLDKKSSKAYSPDNMTFDNYVIDTRGIVRSIHQGTLRRRATSDVLLEELREIKEQDEKTTN